MKKMLNVTNNPANANIQTIRSYFRTQQIGKNIEFDIKSENVKK